MIRMILFVVVGLLAGLGAGTGFAVIKAKSAFASDSARRAKAVSDSLAEHTAAPPASNADAAVEHVDSADESHEDRSMASTPPAGSRPSPATAAPERKTGAPQEASRHAGAEPAAAAGGPASPAASSAPGTTARPPVTTAASVGDDVAQPRRISRIFAAMPARDAAKVLAQMDDATECI